jgi:hypothetical protein
MLEELSVDDLRRELKEKEQTVATLTGYLEQAASKLNQLQKQAAANKPARAFDEAEVARQMALVKDLEAAVEEWNRLKAPDTLGQISKQLDRLRDIVRESFHKEGYSSSKPMMNTPSSGPVSQAQASGLSSLKFLTPAPESAPQKGKGLEGWEALKAEMLKSDGIETEKDKEEGHIDLKEELEVLVNRPTRVDAGSNDRAAWLEAVDSREKYIISLIRALRVVEGRRRGSPDWESFTEAPADLRAQVAQLASEMQQSLRNAEVELSIERARLSRQESLIAQQQRELDKARKKQGLSPKPGSGTGTDTQGRWLKFLGKGNTSAND